MSDDRDGGIHLAVTLAADRLPVLGMPTAVRPQLAQRAVVGASGEAGPDERFAYLQFASFAWLRFALAAGLAMVGLAYAGHLLAGDNGLRAGAAIGATACFFCLAGAVYLIWKTCWALWARSRARRYGTQDLGYLRAATRSTPHNSSLVAQAVVGVITFYLVVTLW
jgi:hypothetical protein